MRILVEKKVSMLSNYPSSIDVMSSYYLFSYPDRNKGAIDIVSSKTNFFTVVLSINGPSTQLLFGSQIKVGQINPSNFDIYASS